jgi:hypothetical protein
METRKYYCSHCEVYRKIKTKTQICTKCKKKFDEFNINEFKTSDLLELIENNRLFDYILVINKFKPHDYNEINSLTKESSVTISNYITQLKRKNIILKIRQKYSLDLKHFIKLFFKFIELKRKQKIAEYIEQGVFKDENQGNDEISFDPDEFSLIFRKIIFKAMSKDLNFIYAARIISNKGNKKVTQKFSTIFNLNDFFTYSIRKVSEFLPQILLTLTQNKSEIMLPNGKKYFTPPITADLGDKLFQNPLLWQTYQFTWCLNEINGNNRYLSSLGRYFESLFRGEWIDV